MEMVINNIDIEPNDLSTVNCNSDLNIDNVSDTETINYDTKNKNSLAQQQAKKMSKTYRNLKWKTPIKSIM